MAETKMVIERNGNFSVSFNLPDTAISFGLETNAAERLLSFARDALKGGSVELISDDTRETLKANNGIVTLSVRDKDTGDEQFGCDMGAKTFASALADSVSENIRLWTIPNYHGILMRQGQTKLDELAKTPDVAEAITAVTKLLNEIKALNPAG